MNNTEMTTLSSLLIELSYLNVHGVTSKINTLLIHAKPLNNSSFTIHPPIRFTSVLFFCPFLVASLSSSSAVVSRMTTRNVAGAYPTCQFLSSTSLQYSFSVCSPLKMTVSHCCRSISFPIGLYGFLVYAWVAISVAPEHTCDHLLCPNVSRHCMISLFVFTILTYL